MFLRSTFAPRAAASLTLAAATLFAAAPARAESTEKFIGRYGTFHQQLILELAGSFGIVGLAQDQFTTPAPQAAPGAR